MITQNRTRTVLTLAAVAMAILVTTTHQVSAAVLTHDATVEVSDTASVFDVSVFPGKAGYDDGTDSGVFGDGTVLDYRFFNNTGTTFNGTGYADGGAGLVSEATATNSNNTNGGALHWADVWTTNDPGVGFSNPTNFTTATIARSQGVSGTIDISGLQSGTLYFIYGTYENPNTVALTMSGTGQPDVLADHTEDPPLINKAWISSFDFSDAAAYDTISYFYTNTDTDGSRARFMGVILDGVVVYPMNPSPADKATDVLRDVVLSWTPGEFANTHDVYFGTVFGDVNDADRTNPLDVLASQGQIATTYDPPDRLDLGQTYFWRIDEVNAPPDSTIFKGEVWSFTTEPIGYPIENVTATASSSIQGQGPENTVNGSGLDVNYPDLHSTNLEAMWLSDTVGPQPTWIQYEFDKVYKLHEMWVWNHNGLMEPMVGVGFKDVSIEYSVNGTDYMTLGTTHEFARGTAVADYEHNTTVDFGGAAAKFVRLTANSSWVGFLPQYGLSEVRFLYIPVQAREPGPDSGATDVDVDVTLGFRAGREAAKHDVYLSTDEQAVIDGTAPVTTVTENSYSTSLDIASTYYWRVDEINDAETPTTWQGEIWSLSTPEFLVVDDFESYNDLDPGEPESNRIFNMWIDGYDNPAVNGSIVGYGVAPFAEQTIVYSGRQSMPFSYGNSTASNSEATANVADLQVVQDWSKNGIQYLTLYFRGKSDNVTGQLYLKINNTKINYSGATTDIKLGRWCAWTIDLSSVTIVNNLTIGIEGGSGMIYVDDIVLYGDSVISTGPLFSSLVQNFDDLAVGSSLHDVDGWEGWLGDPNLGARVTDAVAYSGTNSLEIVGGRDDLAPNWRIQTDGKWMLTVMQYVPTASVGTMDFNVMSVYNPGTWLATIYINCDTSEVSLDELEPVVLIRDQWTEMKIVMDLPNDVCEYYYDGLPLGETACPSSQAINFWPNNNAGTIVYYDDFKFEPEE